MQRLGLPGTKSFDKLKSLSGPVSGSGKTFSLSSRTSSDSMSFGSFTNLKLTAEKLVKEQASVKTDLDMANSKLKKSMDHIRALEEKLQNAFNENAKLRVKQKEDQKLWNGLESKFSTTKSLCDQLTETLQHLASQAQDAEKDKKFFEDKLSASSTAYDSLNQQMSSLSLKVEATEENLRNREKELQELKSQNEEKDKFCRDEQCKIVKLMGEKDAMTKKFEQTLDANRLAMGDLNSKLTGVQLELRSKEDEIRHLITSQENLEIEKNEAQLNIDELSNKLSISLQEVKRLEGLVHVFAAQLVELDNQSLTFLDKFDLLNSLYGSCFELVQQERDLAAKHAQKDYDQLHDNYVCITSEKEKLQLLVQELNQKITELQKAQESEVEQLSEQCCSLKEEIQRLESEAEKLASKKSEKELLISKLEEKIESLLEDLRSLGAKMQDLVLKISALETEKQDTTEKFQAVIKNKEEEIDNLQKVSMEHEQHVFSLEKEVLQLHSFLEEKEQIILQYNEKQKKLEDQTTENQALLTSVESKLVEARKQYDLMLDSKQLELSKHLKEISLRNDQAINDIRRKYDVEKVEILNREKEKVDKIAEEMERVEQRLAETKEESRQRVMRIQGEHAALVDQIKQDQEQKEKSLKVNYNEELKRVQLQAENDLRERTTLLRNEHEVQMKALKCQYEDECRKLKEELDMQKSKEERQKALLQLQWKVMSDKPKEGQEVNSKKTFCSIPSGKLRKTSGGKRIHHALLSPQNGEQNSPPQMPVTNSLKKVEDANTGSVTSIPKHHKKVTHHEYEVETSNGRTITKRRKTKSTVMYEDPRKCKRNTPKVNTPQDISKGVKGGGHPKPSNIGDLFSEGSLNPYADDPYAFD